MPDDLDAPILFPFAIAVMEFEPIRSEGIAEVGSQAFDLSVDVGHGSFGFSAGGNVERPGRSIIDSAHGVEQGGAEGRRDCVAARDDLLQSTS